MKKKNEDSTMSLVKEDSTVYFSAVSLHEEKNDSIFIPKESLQKEKNNASEPSCFEFRNLNDSFDVVTKKRKLNPYADAHKKKNTVKDYFK